MRRLRRVVVLAFAVVLPACNAGQDPTLQVGDDTAVSSRPASTAPLVAPPLSTPAVDPRAHLTGVTAAADPARPGGSRVVFEFDSVVPGYRIDYVQRPVTEDGSGDEVKVEGLALLQVRFENAGAARLEGEKVVRTYTGPDRVAASGDPGVVLEVVDAGDFEGVTTWVVGLRQRVAGVSVSTLSGPARLVLDVPSAAAP